MNDLIFLFDTEVNRTWMAVVDFHVFAGLTSDVRVARFFPITKKTIIAIENFTRLTHRVGTTLTNCACIPVIAIDRIGRKETSCLRITTIVCAGVIIIAGQRDLPGRARSISARISNGTYIAVIAGSLIDRVDTAGIRIATIGCAVVVIVTGKSLTPLASTAHADRLWGAFVAIVTR
tara:strand:- start:563 stop:1093 length:531 start_codon:yes stop_codon:yes gene_type:complete